jgi:rhamnosyltransferase
MSVALIVRAFNEEAHIGRLLTGVARQTEPPDDVLVVDSGSTDATRSIASAFGARIIPIAPEQFSFGRALNVGLTATDCSVAVFASAHVYPVYDTWLEHVARPFQDERVALAYGRQQTPPEGRFAEQRVLDQWFPLVSQTRQPHPFCNNANAAVRREIWERLPFDEDLTGLEDLDWGKRAQDAGWSVSYVAEAPVVHVHDEPFAQVVNRYRREALAYKQIYDEQEMGARRALALATANIGGDLRAALHARIGLRRAADIPVFRCAQFWGTYRGFAQHGPVTDVLRRRFYYPAAFPRSSGSELSEESIGTAINYESGRS